MEQFEQKLRARCPEAANVPIEHSQIRLLTGVGGRGGLKDDGKDMRGVGIRGEGLGLGGSCGGKGMTR